MLDDSSFTMPMLVAIAGEIVMSCLKYEKVKDPLVFAQNREEAHSGHICYASMEEWKQKRNQFSVFFERTLEIFLCQKLFFHNKRL